MMIRYLTTLVLATALLLTEVKASCETETTALSSCTDDDCKACIAVDDISAWASCDDLVDDICNTMDQCDTMCESCIDMYEDWATCYVENLSYQDDCTLTCDDATGRVEDVSGAAPSFSQLGFVVTFLLAVVA